MIVRTRAGQDADVRTAATEFGSSAVPPPWMRGNTAGWAAAVGKRVTAGEAAGLPAVMRAIRIKAETMAAMGLCFYRDDPVTGLDVEVEPSQDNWQAHLFETGPALEYSAYNWLSDVAAGPEGYGNSFCLKTIGVGARGRREVLELIPVDPDYCRIRRVHGQKLFDIHYEGRTMQGLTSADVFHVRGFTLNGAFSGISPAAYHAEALGHALALSEFAGRYFSNDTSVGLVMEVPGNLSIRAAQRQLAVWELSRGGGRNAHRPAIAYNGTKLNRLGLGLRDSQYIEAQNWTVEQVARIWGVPVDLLEGGGKGGGEGSGSGRVTVEQLGLRFLTFGLFAAIRQFEEALKADPDLRLAQDGIEPRFDTRALLRVDAKTAAEVEHFQIQDGTLMRDEARASRGLGPLPPLPDDPSKEPGKVVPLTPVGAGGATPDATPQQQAAYEAWLRRELRRYADEED